MIKKLKALKIRTQLACLLLVTGLLSYILFSFMWVNRWNAYELINPILHLTPSYDNPDLFDELEKEAVKYDIPASEKDTKAIQELDPFFSLCDKYTSIYIYGLDGIYRAGRYAKIMDGHVFRDFFDIGYQLTGGEGEKMQEIPLQFKNGTALVMLYFYHDVFFLYPYVMFCAVVIVIFFLSVILCCISRKMKQMIQIQKSILRMSAGDLETAVPRYGQDEIGILASELDKLRVTLDDTLQQEKSSRQANQDLISAMSHDLRTPLTILNGYLEILKTGKFQDKQEEYLNRCLKKTKDIKDMTDRMFEYALVFEKTETPDLVSLPLSFYQECLSENVDFIKLAGFSCDTEYSLETADTSLLLPGDKTMVKRIFNNLFSNILKYGDKSSPVRIRFAIDNKELTLLLKNKIKRDPNHEESNQIGLKSIEKMLLILDGRILYSKNHDEFSVCLTFSSCMFQQ